MGSPKAARIRNPTSRRMIYQLILLCLGVSAVYVVVSKFGRTAIPSASDVSGTFQKTALPRYTVMDENEGLTPLTTSEMLEMKNELGAAGELRRTALVRDAEKSNFQERWIEKPSSLCYGHGNITILTVTVGLPKDYLSGLRRNRFAYVNAHGYRYCEVMTSLDFDQPISVTRIKAMLLLLSFADIVVHLDADVLIMNKSVSIESILALRPYNMSKKDAIYTNDYTVLRDVDPDEMALINTAVYIMRSTAWSKAFLEIQYRFFRWAFQRKLWNQQALAVYRLKHHVEFAEHIAIVPYRLLNVPCCHEHNYYQRGDFIAHFAGGNNREKYDDLSIMMLRDKS
ncbi:hypothetical protein CBR_g33925 [Chara braunii]|uniref:Uncharacterized protein n=1 Tax=Chara braunii TaxID=69332 RepID=A0A388LHJ4_CHABU|nr:hypothetical protein CBR_g33925 [Chara braunii]|eukprot:GBG81747.1 hypothetical protein CBR_g33925 [Chara braunii]